MKKQLLCFLLCLTLLPALALAEVHPLPIDQTGGYPVSTDNLIGDEEYQDESIHVVTQRMTYKKAKCMFVKITIPGFAPAGFLTNFAGT